MRRATALLCTLAGLLVLSGCFRLDVAVELNDDGTGTVREIFAVDPRLAGSTPAAFGDTPDPAGAGAEAAGRLGSWARVRPYRERGLEGVTVDVTFDGPVQLADRLRRVNRALTDATGAEVRSEVILEPVDGGWRFRATPAQLGLVADLTPLGARVDPGRFAGAEVFLAVRLPGHVVAHNGDRVDGNLVSWRIPLVAGNLPDRSVLTAESRPGPPPRSAPTLTGRRPGSGAFTVAAVVVATLGGGLVLALSRRRAVEARPAGK